MDFPIPDNTLFATLFRDAEYKIISIQHSFVFTKRIYSIEVSQTSYPISPEQRNTAY